MQDVHPRHLWSQSGSWLARNPLGSALALGILLGSIVFLSLRARGLMSDEGSACTIAQGILQGRLPYKFYFNEKPPLQYFWTAAIMAISQPTFFGARLAPAVTLAMTAACILCGLLARTRNLLVILGWTAMLFLVAVDLSAFLDLAEAMLALLFCASALLVIHEDLGKETPRLKAGLQGVLFGIAIGFRQHAIAPALVMLFLPNARLHKRAYGMGLVLGIVGWLGPLLALGIGPDLYNSTVAFYFNEGVAARYFRRPQWNDYGGFALWIVCFAWLANLKVYRPQLPWLIFWFASMALSAAGRMDAFRLWPSTAAMLVLIAQAAPDKGLAARGSALAFASLAMLTLFRAFPADSSVILAASDRVASATSDKDLIWIGPSNPMVYCLANRRPASRYYFILPWTAKATVRQQIVADITRRAPKLLVLDGYKRELSVSQVLPELLGVVSKHYHAIETYGSLTFYQRNSLPR